MTWGGGEGERQGGHTLKQAGGEDDLEGGG